MRRAQAIGSLCLACLLPLLLAPSCESRIPPEYRPFFAQPTDGQRAQFRTFSLEQQLIVYRYSTMRHPPDPAGLGSIIADRGKEAVPFLLKTLREEQDEVFKTHLTEIFSRMSPATYDVRDDKEAMATLEAAVASIQHAGLRMLAEHHLARIKSGQ